MKNKKILVLSAFTLLVVATIIGCTGTGGSLFPGGGFQTTRLLVADYDYERTLIFSLPVSTNANAAVALGQPDLATQGCNLTANGECGPNDATMDPSGNIWVADISYCRVVQYKPPFTTGMAASVVIGEPDFKSENCGSGAADLGEASNVAFDSSGNLWVTDYDNSRVLRYTPPFTSGMAATLALGQPDVGTTTACTTTVTGLCFPWQGLVFDAQGNLWVSDWDNCRILEYKPPFSTGMAASVVIGQADFNSSSCTGATPTGNDGFYGMAFDKDGNLWAVDADNIRVLEFVPPFTNGMAASKVIGQADLNSSNSGTTASTFSFPEDVSFDSAGNMYVVDTDNSRVLVFAPPFTTGMSATKVLGAADLTTAGACAAAPAANTVCDPAGVTAVP